MLKIPPPVWVFLSLIVTGALSALYPWRSLIDLRFVWLGAALIVLGLAFGLWAVALFRAAGTEINPNAATNKALVVKGPFKWTRNPMYLGFEFVTLGIALCFGTLPLFAAPLIIFVVCNSVHIPFEEAKMRGQFGAAYEDYARAVRRWL